MVYIVVDFKYPTASSEAAGNAFFKAMQDFPNLYREGKPAKRMIGLATIEDPNVTTTIWEVSGEYIDAIREVSKLYLSLSIAVDGSTVSMKTCLSVMEALPILGMKPPT